MKIIIAITFVFILTVLVPAQSPNLGSSGAQFLKIPLSAKESGMAGAVVGLTDDASAIFWNPAGIAKVKSVNLHFSYMKWFELFDMNSAAAAYNLGEWGVIGASAVMFSTGQIEITTEESPNGTQQYYDAQDLAIGVTYARYLTNDFNVGLTMKYINQTIWHETASGFAFDIGTQYALDFRNLTIAMSMSNFGGNLKFSGSDLEVRKQSDPNYPVTRSAPADLRTSEYPLPLSFQVGVGFDVYKSEFIKVVGGIDAVHPNDNNERVQVGSEVSVYDRFFVRGGYTFNHDTQRFSFGAGANVPAGNTIIDFSYSYSYYHILPVVHRISVGLSFL
ncbi:MAG: PorV/PorQ family protein [Ignavibacteriales bacterium]|nr:PorV/PorQ family protein [Ignavibacteriales bacterium]